MPAWVAAMIWSRPFSPAAATASVSPAMMRLEGLGVLPLRVLGRERPDPVQREGDLEIDRLLGPERAVVVEDSDALGRRHEVGPRHACDEVQERPLRRPLVPGGQGVGLRTGGTDTRRGGGSQQHGKRNSPEGPARSAHGCHQT